MSMNMHNAYAKHVYCLFILVRRIQYKSTSTTAYGLVDRAVGRWKFDIHICIMNKNRRYEVLGVLSCMYTVLCANK